MKKRLLALLLTLCLLLGLLPATALAAEDGTSTGPVLDISQGSITITNDGYTIGEDTYVWAGGDTNHQITITQSNSSAAVGNYIDVTSGTAEITLKGVNLSGDETHAPLAVNNNGTTATLILEGKNTLVSNTGVKAALEIGNGSVVNIKVQDGATDESGVLNAIGGNQSAGIGASNNGRGAGTLNIQSGTISAASSGSYSSGIGPSRARGMTAINISGGHVTSGGNNNLGQNNGNTLCGTVTISGGTIVTVGIAGSTVSITGGNIGDAYTGEVAGRKLTKLAFFNEDGTPKANTQVTVKEGEDKWTALTDGAGMVTTYLAEGTSSVSVQIGEDEEENVSISNSLGVVGATCTCAGSPGTLAMTTQPQTLTVTGESQTLELAAAYTKNSCVLPDGFHGEYENIRYEIVSVEKNGQPMNAARYAKVEGGTLTVYSEASADPYTVYVRAVSGPEGKTVESGKIAIQVETYVAAETPAGSNTLDIGLGSIEITAGTDNNSGKTVYTQGGKTLTVDAGTQVTITGSTETNTITVKGGNPTIVLKDVTMTSSGNSPFAVSGNGTNVTVILEGENTLVSTNSSNAALQIGKDSTVSIQVPEGKDDASGVLNATGGSQAAGIGASYYGDSPYGTLNIKSGTISAAPVSNAYAAGIGSSRNRGMAAVNISGGHVTSGGNGLGRSGNVTISGGTIVTSGISGTTVSITGGNIGDAYSEAIEGRTLTRLYFVDENGTPKANTQVTVKEGEDEWTALTDENGVVTTYFASSAADITAGVGSETGTSVTLSNDQALIGGTCSCTIVSGIQWAVELPESITLHNLTAGEAPVNMEYDLAAELVTDQPCDMPIHPSLPAVSYSLSVTKDGSAVSDADVSGYAEITGSKLYLKPANAPYTVTLTASAGEKNVTHTITVEKGEATAGEVNTINLGLGSEVTISYAEGSWSVTQGETTNTYTPGTFLLTGDAASDTASVTVNGGSPTLIVNQNDPDDVWSLYSGADAGSITLQARSFNGKLRFGAVDTPAAAWGVLTAEKLKLNPEAGASIVINNDGSVTQGKYAISSSSLDDRTLAVYGANLGGATTITNHLSDAISVDVNDSQSTLAAGGSLTIPQANAVFNGGGSETDDSVRGYIYDNGTKLVYAGEGAATVGHRATWNEVLPYRETVTQVAFDPDISTIAANAVYQLSGIEKLEIKYAASVNGLYNARMKELWLGKQVTNYDSGTYLYYLETITLEAGNTALMLHDGVLYTADGVTLLQCPQTKTGSYTLLESCRSISGRAFFGSSLTTLTLNAGLTDIGDRAFEDATIQEIHVEAGSAAFKSVDGILYTADGKTMILCPAGRTESELVIPEGVTGMRNMAAWQLSNVTSVTLPASLVDVDAYFLVNAPIEEMTIKGMLYPTDTDYDTGTAKFFNSKDLRSLTVPEGYNFADSKLFKNTSMSWVTGISVTGGEDRHYDGTSRSVTVTGPEGATVEYSTDGSTWSAEALSYAEPGAYTVYWKVTHNGGTVYSQNSFTITALEAQHDWFELDAVKPENADNSWTPVTLNRPAAAPSLDGGYTVKYSKDGTGAATTAVPTEAGSYLVTVEITAEGYVAEILTLGYYTVPGNGQVVISFITYGGDAVMPIVGKANGSIDTGAWPSDPNYTGYKFEGWYKDAALREKLENTPTQIPNENTTYYAKWSRETYNITYVLDADDVQNDNPATYHVETPTFTLTAPVRPGYKFLGWTWTEQSEPQLTVTIEKGSTGNKSYTAKWEKINYNITYGQYLQQTEPASYNVNTVDIPLSKPADREGYTFLGWTVKNNAGVAFNVSPGADGSGTLSQAALSSLLGDITVSGMWLANDVTLILNANGGTFSDGSKTLTISAKFDSNPTLETPTRDGYTFSDWYLDEACTQEFSGTVAGTGRVTLYAGWTRQNTGNGGGGGGGGGSVTRYEVSAPAADNGRVTVSPASASKGQTVTITVTPDEGYELASLTVTDKDGKAVTLTDKGDGKYTFTMPGGKVTVTARFRAVEPTPVVLPFTDVAQGAWYYDAVVYAYENGLMEGTGDTTFAPGMTTTRSMLATLLYRLEGEPAVSGGAVFTDVPAGAWYTDAVAWAAREGVVNGVGDGTAFAPDTPITREQMAVMLYRYAQYKGYDVSQGGMAAREYADYGQVADWARYAMDWAVAAGLITGTSDTTLSPQGQATRAEIATILMRFCENVVK